MAEIEDLVAEVERIHGGIWIPREAGVLLDFDGATIATFPPHRYPTLRALLLGPDAPNDREAVAMLVDFEAW